MNKKFLAVLFFLLSACGVYQPIEIIPDHIQTVMISPIKNETSQIDISTTLRDEVINEFVKEGRLTVKNSPDVQSRLDITVIEYTKIPISYDENLIAEEYKLNMIVNLRYSDLVDKVMLWEDVREDLTGGIESWVKYEVGTNVEFAETEEEARQRLIEDIAEKILQRTIYGWQ